MKPRLVIMGVLILFSTVLLAQETTWNSEQIRESYNKHSIHFAQRFFAGVQYVKDGKEFPIGFFYKNLAQELSSIPEAKEYSDAAKKDGVTAITSILIGGGVFLVMSEGNPLLGLVIYTGSFIFTMSKMMSQYNNLQKAVWVYNREAAVPKE